MHLLATPDPNRGRAGGIEDQFSSQRPIIAVVKKGRYRERERERGREGEREGDGCSSVCHMSE